MGKEQEEFIIKLLDQEEKAFVGSELVEKLREKFPDCKEDNLRKIISKCSQDGKIQNSKPMKFGKNQYAYFSKKLLWGYDLFKDVIKEHKPALSRVIFALKRNKKLLSFGELYKIAGCCHDSSAHAVKVENILNDLNYLKIAEKKIYKGKYEFVCYPSIFEDERQFEQELDRLESSTILLKLLLYWLKRVNIINSDYVFKGPGNNFLGIRKNDIYWDGWAYTNTIGLGTKDKKFQTIVVIDFCSKDKYEEYDFEGFKNRVEKIIFSVKNEPRKVLPIIFAYDFSPTALKNIKYNNYMCFNIGSILGKNSLEIVNGYKSLKDEVEKNIEEMSDENYTQKIEDNLGKIDKSDVSDNYENLKGHFFEYLMFPVIREIYNERDARICHNFKGSINGDNFECDYHVDMKKEDIFFELKGYKEESIIPLGKYNEQTKKPEKDTLRWFLNHTLALCKKKVYKKEDPKPSKFCYITTAHFSKEALKVLEEKNNSKEKPKEISCFFDHESLIKLLRKYKMKKEINIIKQFYSSK